MFKYVLFYIGFVKVVRSTLISTYVVKVFNTLLFSYNFQMSKLEVAPHKKVTYACVL